MRVAKLNDIQHIIRIFEDSYSNLEGMEMWLSQRLRNTIEYTYILNDENTAMMIFERIGNFKCQFHVYSLISCRGKDLKKFCIKAAKYIILNYNYTLFLTFVPENHLGADVFARLLGCTKVSKLADAGGEYHQETLYMITKQQFVDRFLGRE